MFCQFLYWKKHDKIALKIHSITQIWVEAIAITYSHNYTTYYCWITRFIFLFWKKIFHSILWNSSYLFNMFHKFVYFQEREFQESHLSLETSSFNCFYKFCYFTLLSIFLGSQELSLPHWFPIQYSIQIYNI